MKILTWNINGIRSAKKDRSLKELFDLLDADIICLQETKITRELLEEEIAIVDGYNAYFSFSKVRSGYSGVATFCRNYVTPIKAEDRIHLTVSDSDDVAEENRFTRDELESLNAEGRTVLTEHVDKKGNHVVLMNLYCPRADLDNQERTEFKLKFFCLVQNKCQNLIEEKKHVILLGDFNVSHKPIDHCDPDDPEIFDSNPSRQWANTFISDAKNDQSTAYASSQCSPVANSQVEDKQNETPEERETNRVPKTTKVIDSFRYFHPSQKSAFTCWSTLTGARQTNYGTRIDYIFSSAEFFREEFTECIIRPDIEGSDHCPVVATLKNTFQNTAKAPSLCTKYMPEFSGKQQKLKDFFKKSEKNTNILDLNQTANKTKENSCLVNVDGSKMSGVSQRKTQKRPAQSSLKCHAKRLKIKTSGLLTSQGKIFQFLGKTSKPNINTHQQTDACLNVCDSFLSEGKPEIVENSDVLQQCSSLDSSSQNSTSSISCSSGSSCSTKSTSRDAIEFPEELKGESDEKNIPKKQSNLGKNAADVVSSWKNILKGLPPAPSCSGHKEPCVLRTVKNNGPNHGKRFYCCARPQGHSSNKEARCNTFIWLKK